MVLAPDGHLLVSNSDGINSDPNQPSEIVEFTVNGQFVGQLSVDPAQGGPFGLNILQVTDDVVRFAGRSIETNYVRWRNSPEATKPRPYLIQKSLTESHLGGAGMSSHDLPTVVKLLKVHGRIAHHLLL